MVRLAESPELRAQQGAAGRAWVEQYHGWRTVAEQHKALYERVLAEHRAGRRNGHVKLAPSQANRVEVLACSSA